MRRNNTEAIKNGGPSELKLETKAMHINFHAATVVPMKSYSDAFLIHSIFFSWYSRSATTNYLNPHSLHYDNDCLIYQIYTRTVILWHIYAWRHVTTTLAEVGHVENAAPHVCASWRGQNSQTSDLYDQPSYSAPPPAIPSATSCSSINLRTNHLSRGHIKITPAV